MFGGGDLHSPVVVVGIILLDEEGEVLDVDRIANRYVLPMGPEHAEVQQRQTYWEHDDLCERKP